MLMMLVGSAPVRLGSDRRFDCRSQFLLRPLSLEMHEEQPRRLRVDVIHDGRDLDPARAQRLEHAGYLSVRARDRAAYTQVLSPLNTNLRRRRDPHAA